MDVTGPCVRTHEAELAVGRVAHVGAVIGLDPCVLPHASDDVEARPVHCSGDGAVLVKLEELVFAATLPGVVASVRGRNSKPFRFEPVRYDRMLTVWHRQQISTRFLPNLNKLVIRRWWG